MEFKFGDYEIQEEPKEVKKESWLINQIYERLLGGRNFMACVCGGTGDGKSYLTLRILELLSKRTKVPFTADQIIFDPSDLFNQIGPAPMYTGFMVDEAGLTLDSRKWASAINSLFAYIAETFRFKRYVLFFVCPDLGFIDSRSRKLTHAFIRIHQPFGKEARVYRLKCLPYNTEVVTFDGVNTLEDLYKESPVKLPSYNFANKTFEKDTALLEFSGKLPLTTIKFEDGTEIKASENHRFFASRNGVCTEKMVSEMVEGDTLVGWED